MTSKTKPRRLKSRSRYGTAGGATRTVEPRGRRGAWLATAAIVLAGGLAYANSFSAPFVFDGASFVRDNPRVRQWWPPSTPMGNTSRPLSYLTFAMNYAAHGKTVWGYHLVNLLIHLAAALTLYGVLGRTLAGPRLASRYASAAPQLALAAAMLWTVHPLQTQSVTYLYQRHESLMGLFFLLTLYTFIRAVDSARPTPWLAASWLCCVLGTASKEVMVTAPIVILWYDRALVASSWREIARRRWGYYVALASTWLLAAGLLYSVSAAFRTAGLLDVQAKYDSAGNVLAEPMTPWEYARTQPAVILHYLRLCFWPAGQCLEPVWPIAGTALEIVPPLVGILSLLALTAWCVWRWPAWGFLGGWFFVILGPTSSVAPIVNLAFEHRMYLSSAAVATAVVVAAYEASLYAARRWAFCRGLRPRLALAVVAATVAALTGATYARNAVYRSETSVWQDVIAHSPLPNFHAYQHIGNELLLRGDLPGAIASYERGLEIIGPNAKLFDSLGRAYSRRGDRQAAEAYYARALGVDPTLPSANVNLAQLLRGENPDEAIRYCRKALQSAPDLAEAHDTLANLLQDKGQFDEALTHYRLALKHDPDDVPAHHNLACLLARCGQFPEAIAEFKIALSLDPRFQSARRNLQRAEKLLTARGAQDEPDR
jgi:tetratricopeptide (TPR) repeat protein